jgi:hypothetical protein
VPKYRHPSVIFMRISSRQGDSLGHSRSNAACLTELSIVTTSSTAWVSHPFKAMQSPKTSQGIVETSVDESRTARVRHLTVRRGATEDDELPLARED